MFIALFGPPGAGKGTQAAFICDELGVPHIATGDIFRKNLKEGTPLGELAKSYMNKGQLVPDEVVWKLVADRLAQPDAAGGVLFDGFPRSVQQARLLVEWLEENGKSMECVAALMVPDEQLVSRLSGRRTCLSGGHTYHVAHNPPRVEGVCDVCGGEVVQREDDNEATVRARLETYHRQTAPVLDFFKALNVVSEVDGTGPIESVTQRLRLALG